MARWSSNSESCRVTWIAAYEDCILILEAVYEHEHVTPSIRDVGAECLMGLKNAAVIMDGNFLAEVSPQAWIIFRHWFFKTIEHTHVHFKCPAPLSVRVSARQSSNWLTSAVRLHLPDCVLLLHLLTPCQLCAHYRIATVAGVCTDGRVHDARAGTSSSLFQAG